MKEPFITIPKSEYDNLMKMKAELGMGKVVYWSSFYNSLHYSHERATLLGESEAVTKMAIYLKDMQEKLSALEKRSLFRRIFNY